MTVERSIERKLSIHLQPAWSLNIYTFAHAITNAQGDNQKNDKSTLNGSELSTAHPLAAPTKRKTGQNVKKLNWLKRKTSSAINYLCQLLSKYRK